MGGEAAPGVPWTHAATPHGDLALMLKSGNFGAPDLFVRALQETR
nr:nucleotide-binding domain containing protein [Streptomyces tailanensis]